MQKYVPPKPSPKPSDHTAFIASLSSNERELHEMAERFLGSSYFVQWTHGYRKWKAAQGVKK
jgi:hypothetical protein